MTPTIDFGKCQLFVGSTPIHLADTTQIDSRSFSKEIPAVALTMQTGRDLFSKEVPALSEGTKQYIQEKAHGFSAECSIEIPDGSSADDLIRQAMNKAIDEAYEVGINIAPTRLPRKAKKWRGHQTKRNQHGMAKYLHILRTNHHELHECTIKTIKETMGGVEVEIERRSLTKPSQREGCLIGENNPF